MFFPTSFMANQPTPPKGTPLRNKDLIAGLMKRETIGFISPVFIRDPGYFPGGWHWVGYLEDHPSW